MRYLDYDFFTFRNLDRIVSEDKCYATSNTLSTTKDFKIHICREQAYVYLFDFEVELFTCVCIQHFMLHGAEDLMCNKVIIYKEDKEKLNTIKTLI